MMADLDIPAVRQRAEKASPGPWVTGTYPMDECRIDGPDDFTIYDEGGHTAADAEFIAHAREDIPALLALVEDLTWKLERALQERDESRAALDRLAALSNRLFSEGDGDD